MSVVCRRGAPLAVALLVWSPWLAEAQRPRVSPFVTWDHWSIEAAAHLHRAGLVHRGYDPELRLQPLAELERVFATAAARSPLGAAYQRRLVEEFGPLIEEPEAPTAVGGISVGGYAEDGRLRVGTGYWNDIDWTGPTPAPGRATPRAGARVAAAAGPLAFSGAGRLDDAGLSIESARALAGVVGVGAWAGYGRFGFRPGPAGGIVLPRTPARPGVGLRTLEAVELPYVGPLHVSSALLRGESNHVYAHPWIWAARVMVSPHERVDVGVNRAAMMGGEGNSPLTLRTLAYVLIGKHSGEGGEYDNQIVSVSIRYRPPLPLPVNAYLEWGFDDSAGAWRDVPGLQAGLDLPVLPGAPGFGVGASWTHMAPSCCGNTKWYRNWSFRGGWADDGESLGHPLGGHGREWLGYGRIDLPGAGTGLGGIVEVGAFSRKRGRENLFVPARAGSALGGYIDASIFLRPGWFLELRVDAETGRSEEQGRWHESRLEGSLRAAFR